MRTKGRRLFELPFFTFLGIFSHIFDVWPTVTCMQISHSVSVLTKEPARTFSTFTKFGDWIEYTKLNFFCLLFAWNGLLTLESEDGSFCLKYYLAKTTLSMSSARRIALECTACHKRFANRWAYNQHRTSGCRKGTSCKSVGLQQSELIANTRGNISTAVLRSTGALRKGRRYHSCYLHNSCIYM